VAAAPLGVAGGGDLQGVGVDLDHRVELDPRQVDAADASQVGLGEPARAEPSGRHRRLELGDGRLLEGERRHVVVGGGHGAGGPGV
jgi:hypothetical protein